MAVVVAVPPVGGGARGALTRGAGLLLVHVCVLWLCGSSWLSFSLSLSLLLLLLSRSSLDDGRSCYWTTPPRQRKGQRNEN